MNRVHRAVVGVLCILGFVPVLAHAQAGSMSVSVTPPLIQLTIGPGETWSSTLKVVNNNAIEATYFASVVDFSAEGENGQGTFSPLIRKGPLSSNSYSLASWLLLASTSVSVPPGKSAELPFTVNVPVDAEPGGHYAAVLIGTDPGAIQLQGPTMRIASYVSSLIFVKIRGETVEQGRIREFRTSESQYESPAADFILRFENTGTTHVKPQGDIVIYNMWGKKRGELQVNDDSGNFGNVLPHSTRKFTFTWVGESDFLDIGRYSAVTTLTYGDDGRQNVSATTYFWIVPTAPVAVGLISIAVILGLLSWLIRRYIRRALELERGRLGIASDTPVPAAAHVSFAALAEPVREGVVDLRRTVAGTSSTVEAAAHTPRPLTFIQFVRKYALFFLFLIALSVTALSIAYYAHTVSVSSRNFQISDVKISEDAPVSDVRIVQ